MRKKPHDRSKTGLPVPAVSAGAVPVLTEHAQLDANLGALKRGLDGERAFGTFCRPSTEETVSCLKAALPFIDKWRADWRALDRPATTDEIATEMLRLATTMPNARNIDQGMLADTLCGDTAELRPTAWALERGCRAHRAKSEFLSLAKLEKEIRDAEWRAKLYRRLLKRDLVEELKSAENNLALELKWAKDEVRRKRERDQEQKLLEKRRAEEELERARRVEAVRREIAEWDARWLRDHKHSDAPDE
jgi:hypothetical protein